MNSLSAKIINGIDSISINDINKVPLFRQNLRICIFDNKIYLINGYYGEERHEYIINVLREILKKYTLPNLIANIIMKDNNKFNGAYLCNTNCERDNNSLKILVPCWSFYGYNTGPKCEFEKYQDCIDDLLNESIKYKWSERINKLIFKGHSTNPHRKYIIEKLIEKIPDKFLYINIESFSIDSLKNNPSSMKDLCKYKYQLLLNGFGTKLGNESGSIRPKYMLATGSICIYITLDTYIYEWWSCNKEICPFIIVCKNIQDAIEKINYFEKNPDKAEKLLEKQNYFVKTILNKENVEKYWYEILCNYASKLEFTIDNPIGKLLIL